MEMPSNHDDFVIPQPPASTPPEAVVPDATDLTSETADPGCDGEAGGAAALTDEAVSGKGAGSSETSAGEPAEISSQGVESGTEAAEPVSMPESPDFAQALVPDLPTGVSGDRNHPPQPLELKEAAAAQPVVGEPVSAVREHSGTSEDAGEEAATAPQVAGPVQEGQAAKKPVSLKRIESNRRNAQKSTGPKSPEGKERSSWNSIKHGLLGKRLIVAEGASAEEWAHLLSSLRADLDPVGALEELLVEKIAKSYWRLQLADGFELNMSNSWTRFFGSMDKMARYQTAIGRQLERDVAALKRLQRERRGSGAVENDASAGEEGGES